MLRLLIPACVAFMAPPHLAPPPSPTGALQSRSCVSSPQMGLFDGFQDAFANDEKLAAKRLAENKSKKVPDYIKKKEQERLAYAKKDKNKGGNKEGDVKTGNGVLDELLKGWTWE